MKYILSITLLALTLTATLAHALVVNDSAPDVKATNQEGKEVKFHDLKGKYVLIYFYPKDETPGCTQEASELRDKYDRIRSLNAVVYGVSRQDQKSHKEFKDHLNLPFDLLVDTDGSIAKAFSVDSYMGMALSHRDSFLIDKSGRIAKIYRDVKPSQHADQVIADIQKMDGAVKK